MSASSYSGYSHLSRHLTGSVQREPSRQGSSTGINAYPNHYSQSSSIYKDNSSLLTRNGPIKAGSDLITQPIYSSQAHNKLYTTPQNDHSANKMTENILTRDYYSKFDGRTNQRPGVSLERSHMNKPTQPNTSLAGVYTSGTRNPSSYDRYSTEMRNYPDIKNFGIEKQIKPTEFSTSTSRRIYDGNPSPEHIRDRNDVSEYQERSYTKTQGDSLANQSFLAHNESSYSGRLHRLILGKDRFPRETYKASEQDQKPTTTTAGQFEGDRRISSTVSHPYSYSLSGGKSTTASEYSKPEDDRMRSGKPVEKKVENVNKSVAFTPSEPRGLVGLNNIGNTCFMNSILQCLFNIYPIIEYYQRGNHVKDLNSKNDKGIAKAFFDLLGRIHAHAGAPKYSGESTLALKRRIETSNALFSGYDQQDAQEFLKALLEGINDDLNRVLKKPPYVELKAEPTRPIQAISNEWFSYMLGRDNSIVTDLFSGQLLNKTICSACKTESLSFDNFWDLSLSFTKGTSKFDRCDLKRMIDHFFREETLNDPLDCSKCKKKREFRKGFVLWRLPQVLVLHLKRFYFGKYKKEKITHKVTFPIRNLDLSEFVRESQDPSVKNPVYSLFAVVNHSGSLNGGHYTSECLNPYNRKWYSFNDSSVRPSYMINEKDDEAEGENPYILFYIRN